MKHPVRRARPWRLMPALVATLVGCTTGSPFIPNPINPLKRGAAAPGESDVVGAAGGNTQLANETGLYQTPVPPAPQRDSAGARSAAAPKLGNEKADTSLMFEQVSLTAFIQTVYGAILKKNVSVDPAVEAKKDLVSLRTGSPQTPSQVAELARGVLKSYGIAVSDYGSLVRVTLDTAQTGYLPEIRRGRAMPDTPLALRPVFQLVELEAVSPAGISNWLKTIFGSKVQAQDDLARQAVLLSGQRDDVQAAMEAIQMLDQPAMRGRISARIAPVFWSADEFAKRLSDVLQAEGYSVSTQPNGQSPTILLPVAPLNSIIVFSAGEDVLNHVLHWARELDQPGQGRGTAGYFTYPVKNTDAAGLAKTLQEVMNPAAAATVAGGQAATQLKSRVVVNAATNSLIIQGNSSEYQQWLGLLQELDKPAKSALISVTIAEVRLTDTEQLGVEWMLNTYRQNGYKVDVGTMGNLNVSKIGGLAATISNAFGDPRVLINALASTSRVKVLSNPSLVTRNGETATIQVGQEVPVIQSTQSTNTGGIQAGVLQTVQYRQTGVILKVRPVIHASGRLELDVSQEVSSAANTLTGVSASPTFSTRKIDTKLTVLDGNTVLLGGLMQQSTDATDTGVPLLKDIPVAGVMFKNNTDKLDRTELIVLITPNVIQDDFDAQAVTDAFRARMSWAAPKTRARWEGTMGAAIRGDIPMPRPNIDLSSTPAQVTQGEGALPIASPKPAAVTPAASVPTPNGGAAPIPSAAPAPLQASPTQAPSPERSKPYVLPPPGSKPATSSAQKPPVAPTEAQTEVVPQPEPGPKPVLDEKLRQELLDHLRKSR